MINTNVTYSLYCRSCPCTCHDLYLPSISASLQTLGRVSAWLTKNSTHMVLPEPRSENVARRARAFVHCLEVCRMWWVCKQASDWGGGGRTHGHIHPPRGSFVAVRFVDLFTTQTHQRGLRVHSQMHTPIRRQTYLLSPDASVCVCRKTLVQHDSRGVLTCAFDMFVDVIIIRGRLAIRQAAARWCAFTLFIFFITPFVCVNPRCLGMIT